VLDKDPDAVVLAARAEATDWEQAGTS
jgi:hypothetical protein